MNTSATSGIPDALKECIAFHGHFCPGLVYGYMVATEAIRLLNLKRSHDEEVVAICESDSCAVDALQMLLGTTAGKGNLVMKNYGKNAYTIMHRPSGKSYRFSRKYHYQYASEYKDEFDMLDKAISDGTATEQQRWRHKLLKAKDLLAKPFDEVFSTSPADDAMPSFAPLARSEACAVCGEMTMATKMIETKDGRRLCIPCSEKR